MRPKACCAQRNSRTCADFADLRYLAAARPVSLTLFYCPLYTALCMHPGGNGKGRAVVDGGEQGKSGSHHWFAGDVAAKSGPHACFLCTYSDHACDVAYVDGYIRDVELRGPRERRPVVLIETDVGGDLLVVLPEHALPLARALANLPTERRDMLRLRIFHLLRAMQAENADDEVERRRLGLCVLRTTPVSAVVLEPDLLLNITDINNAEYCVRQYPLRRMVPSPPTAATVRGTLIHSAFKELLKTGGRGHVRDHLALALHAQLTDLALHQLPADAITADAEPHLLALDAWYARERDNLWGSAPQVRAETFLLAPEVGLKGRLDFFMQDALGGSLLELKTGATHSSLPKREHRWQVYGYQTLLAARHPNAERRPSATLLYSGTPGHAEGYGIPFALRDLHRVLDLRNHLALVHASGVVPAPPSPGKCAKCMLREDCLRASHLLGWQPPESDQQRAMPQHAEAEWFAQQYELLRMEARAAEEQATWLWRLSAEERRAAGIALGGLKLAEEPVTTESGEWEYTFHCENTSELREGDAVLLSDGDPVRGAVVSGTILRLSDRGVSVWTPERITNPALLDRYDSDIVHTRTVRNLWRWLDADPHLRLLVSGTRAPTFDALDLSDLSSHFNDEQRLAIGRALAARDFLLVQGPPGTGKTHVVAEIARRAIARGERVLVAAFTNQAVDNVLLRLREKGVEDFVRLGHELSIAPALRGHRLSERTRAALLETHVMKRDDEIADLVAANAAPLDPARLRATLFRAPLVATTTATWSAERFDETGDVLSFDLAIVDEASQLTVPALLGALRFAHRFVLVGDDRQLPPLVISAKAAVQGLKRSLFAELLARWGDKASVALRRQYRMHPSICDFPSKAFYDGGLISEGIARTALLDITLDASEPLSVILAPERPVVFVDVPSHRESPGKTSVAQAELVRRLVLALRLGDVAATDIGAIAPYRAQVAAIRQRLAEQGESEVAVDTVDRFQGGERHVIIYSFGGRVDGERYIHHTQGDDFLADPHRLNVALTRAQRKLILIGDRHWLKTKPILAQLIDYCAQLYGGYGGVISAHW